MTSIDKLRRGFLHYIPTFLLLVMTDKTAKNQRTLSVTRATVWAFCIKHKTYIMKMHDQ